MTKKNDGLATYINSAKDRPSQEVIFPVWEWGEVEKKCVDVAGGPKWVFYNRTHDE